MLGRCDRWVSLADLAIAINQIADSLWILGINRICCTIGDAHFTCDIAKQIKGKVELFLERSVVLSVVAANSQDNGVLAFEVLDSITESFAFGNSAGRVSFWIPPKHNVLVFIIFEAAGISILIGY